MRAGLLTTFCALCAIGCTDTNPSPMRSQPGAATSNGAVDNSAINQRDRDSATKTPLDQNENQGDVDITAKIRKQVVDTEMSVDAQNIKIITQDSKVTLRGPVKTTEEKELVEKIANDVAGSDNVESHLEVVNDR